MWTFVTQLLVTLVLLGFFLVSCQNVMHIVRGSLCFVLKHIHQELDKELGENEGLSDDEEAISTRVVRRRVLRKVTRAQGRAGGRGPSGAGICVQGHGAGPLLVGRLGRAGGQSCVALPRTPLGDAGEVSAMGPAALLLLCPQPAR